MFYPYSVFGLQLIADTVLPGLLDSTATQSADVRIWVDSFPDTQHGKAVYCSPYKDESGIPVLCVRRLENGHFHFEYRDHTGFVINQFGSEIWAQWPDNLTLEDMTTYLFGPILGFVLRLRGVVSLHASGVVIGGWAIAILGAAGAGKSTTAAAFARGGYPVITDDLFVLLDSDPSFHVHPGYPGLRLWPDSVDALWGSPDALPTITPTWDKRYLNLSDNGYEFQTQPVPVVAIYVLGNRSAGPNTPAIENHSDPILLTLIANSYSNYLLDTKMRIREFDLLGRLAGAVPIQRAVPHTDPARLPELCQRIVEDVYALTRSRVA